MTEKSAHPLLFSPDAPGKPAAVLFGGAGEEHAISCLSAHRVLSSQNESTRPLLPVYIDKSGGFRLFSANTGKALLLGAMKSAPERLPELPSFPTFPVRLGKERGFLFGSSVLPVSCAFPVLHGDRGEDGEIQGLLQAAGIPFVGCGVTAGALSADKALTKRIALSLGIPTAPFFETGEQDAEAAKREALRLLSYPLFLKPACLGSSIGASPVPSPEDFTKAYTAARAFGKVLIEEALPVRAELEVAYLFCEGERYSSPGAVLTEGNFYSFREKYGENPHTGITVSPEIGEETAKRAVSYASRLARVIGLRDLSRIDFFLTEEGRLFFNEINTLPGLTDSSLYPALVRPFFPNDPGGAALFSHLFALAEARGGET